MTNADVRQEAMYLVNGARKAVGVDLLDDLPPGVREDCGLCPVAHALEDVAAECGYAFVNADVGWAEFYPGPDGGAHRPEQVAQVAAAWCGTAWEAGPAEAEVHFPEAIREFITLFDCGAFPDLEEGDE
jgi:hypothetical protein